LDKHFREYPPTTAPAGFKCPVSGSPLFPAENQAGPVADALREKLKTVSWARIGLGLPLIEEEQSEEQDGNNNESGTGDSNKTWDAPDTFNPVNVSGDFFILLMISMNMKLFLESNRFTTFHIDTKSNETYSNDRIRNC